jgi:phosphoribosylanthranilate isomerase
MTARGRAVRVKICGVKRPEDVSAALGGIERRAGADWLGFVLFDKSPRAVTPYEALTLSRPARERAGIVALMVDPDDAAVDEAMRLLAPDAIQLHGKETPGRVAAVKARAGEGTEVWKALAVAEAADLENARQFEPVADRLLFDAKPPKTADRPGGHGKAFDWKLIAETRWSRPWLLAGGLTADNVSTAIRVTSAPAVDVSSGVDDAPGVKSPRRIEQFLHAVKTA